MFHTFRHEANNKSGARCVLCLKGHHAPPECKSFPVSQKTKKSRAFKAHLCIRCLGPYVKDQHKCNARCSYCNLDNHHRVLCRKAEQRDIENRQRQRSPTAERGRDPNKNPEKRLSRTRGTSMSSQTRKPLYKNQYQKDRAKTNSYFL